MLDANDSDVGLTALDAGDELLPMSSVSKLTIFTGRRFRARSDRLPTENQHKIPPSNKTPVTKIRFKKFSVVLVSTSLTMKIM